MTDHRRLVQGGFGIDAPHGEQRLERADLRAAQAELFRCPSGSVGWAQFLVESYTSKAVRRRMKRRVDGYSNPKRAGLASAAARRKRRARKEGDEAC